MNNIDNIEFNVDTVFYKTTVNDVKKYLKKENIWLKMVFDLYEWNCININDMLGSKIIDNVLYICESDFAVFEIDGEDVDPVSMLSDFDIDEIQDFIEPVTTDILKQRLTHYEFKIKDINEIAFDLIVSGYDFKEIVEAAYDIEVLD